MCIRLEMVEGEKVLGVEKMLGFEIVGYVSVVVF